MSLVRKFGPAVVWTVAILVITVLPGRITDAVDKPVHSDKVLHLLVFAAGAVFYGIATGSAWRGGMLAFGIGLLQEMAQKFVPGRSFELADVAANAIGSGLGSYLYSRYVRPRLPFPPNARAPR